MLPAPGWVQRLWLRLTGRAAHLPAERPPSIDQIRPLRPEAGPIAIFRRSDPRPAPPRTSDFMLSARLSGIRNYNAPAGRAAPEAHRIAAALKPLPKRRPPALKKRGARHVWLAAKSEALRASARDHVTPLVAPRLAA